MATSRKVFINLPVRDLAKAKEFFGALGFGFNPQFTDDKAACMVLSAEGFVMLLGQPFFKSFTKKAIADARTQTEVMIALSCDSREEVDALVKKALAAGGTPAGEPQDHGFMVSDAFYDLDGHHWEAVWMDPTHLGSSSP
ncbi:MAG: VOC family protein [Polyangiaceae bacterium]